MNTDNLIQVAVYRPSPNAFSQFLGLLNATKETVRMLIDDIKENGSLLEEEQEALVTHLHQLLADVQSGKIKIDTEEPWAVVGNYQFVTKSL